MRKGSDIPFIKFDRDEVVRYTSDTVQGMFTG